jgi:hypothetical protein
MTKPRPDTGAMDSIPSGAVNDEGIVDLILSRARRVHLN